MSVQLRFDIENLPELRRRLGPDLVEKAVGTALSRVARKARTTVSKEVRQIYNIKARDIARTVKVRRIRRGGYTAAYLLQYTGGRVPLDKFGMRTVKVSTPRGERKGITVQVKKTTTRRRVKGAFPVNINGPKAFRRKGESRLPIARLTSVSVPQMVSNSDVIDDVLKRVRKETPIEFDRSMNIAIDRAIRRLS